MRSRAGISARGAVDVLKYALALSLLVYLVARGVASLGYYWQWYRVPRYLFELTEQGFIAGPLPKGLLVTLRITASSLVLAFLFGLAAVLLRLSGSFTGRAVSRVYLELIRNTPLLIQLFFLYFAIAPVLGMSAFFTAVLALSLFEGAYVSEILRAGILGVPKGQWEAGLSLGLSPWESYRFVVLPQAFRSVLPPLASQAISLVKDSALVSTIAIYDLTMQGQAIVAETFLTFEVWFVVAAIYLAVTLTLSALAHGLERSAGHPA
ncbi:MAG TPA: amino acid ABC transporter permease [Deltaproteobacteria bacterium]|nr:amino acid ABC transporter permease [Deltaproteobacteria bacterium]HOI07326.1 amino acid ABC transporter permease [Deltaproteobacteria bacterium]